MKIKQAIVLSIALGASFAANAGTVASSEAPTTSTIPMATDGSTVIKGDVTFTLSRGVSLGWTMDAVAASLETLHKSSAHKYQGTTAGGSVKECTATVAVGSSATAPSGPTALCL
jgi:hypothetical protein